MSRAALLNRPLDAASLQAEVSAPGAGALSLFVGTVRDTNAGRVVSGIEYSAYATMALRELHAIVAEAEQQYAGVHIVVEHRVGTLAIGEASVVVATSHAHRAEAMEACRYVVEALKARVPIWKCEHYVDGTRAWVHGGSRAASSETAGRVP